MSLVKGNNNKVRPSSSIMLIALDKDGSSNKSERILLKRFTLRFSNTSLEKDYVRAYVKNNTWLQRVILCILSIWMVVLLPFDFTTVELEQPFVPATLKIIIIIAAIFMFFFSKTEMYFRLASETAWFQIIVFSLLSLCPIISRMVGLYPIIEIDGFDLSFLLLVIGTISTTGGLRHVVGFCVCGICSVFYCVSALFFYPGASSNSSSLARACGYPYPMSEVYKWISYALLGWLLFTFISQKLEVNDRRSYILTNRLKQESIDLHLQLERVKFFNSRGKEAGRDSLECVISPGDIKLKDTIGTGGFGEVKRGEWMHTNVAVKMLRKEMSEEVMREFHDEAAIMSQMRHPNIVLFMGVSVYPPMLVMELMPRGSVFKILHIDRCKLDWTLVLKMAIDAARGMSFLHGNSPTIIHRDLKSLNLLVSRDWNVKVSDFGLSSLKEKMYKKKSKAINDDPSLREEIGTLGWTAPEVFNDGIITEKADVYSYGVILFELLAKKVPYTGISNHAIVHLVTEGTRPSDSTPVPEVPNLKSLKKIMKSCWAEDPDDRPRFVEICAILEQTAMDQFPKVDDGQTWEDLVIVPMSAQYRDALELEGLSIDMKELVLGPKIGKGSYATVYEGKYGGTHVAIKETFFELSTKEVLDEFVEECAVMKKLRHPNIVLFMGSCSSETKLYMVTELMVRGSIHQIYQNFPNLKDEKQHMMRCIRLAADGCRGMQYLHNMFPPLIHRDIKSPNVLVDEHWVGKMADFGLSRFKDENKTMTQCGSPLWVAPEVLKGERFGEPCDVYSFAIILWELVSWCEPYPGLSSMAVMKGVASGDLRPSYVEGIPDEYQKIMIQMWAHRPEDRPTFQVVLKQLERLAIQQQKVKHAAVNLDKQKSEETR